MTPEELELLLLTVPRDQLLAGVHHPVPPYIAEVARLAVHTPEELRKWLPLIYAAEDNEELFIRRMGVLLLVRNHDYIPRISINDPSTWNGAYRANDALAALKYYAQHDYEATGRYTYWVLVGAPVDYRTAAFPAFLAADPSLLPMLPAPAARTAVSPLLDL